MIYLFKPERVEPPDPRHPDYDVRADVWSLGISLVSNLIEHFLKRIKINLKEQNFL